MKKELEIGDKVIVTDGEFKGDKGKIKDISRDANMAKVKIKLRKIKSWINLDDLKLIQKKNENPIQDMVDKLESGLSSTWKKTFTQTIDNDTFTVKIRNRRTTVILEDKTRASVYCYKDDIYNEEKGVLIAFNYAKRKQFIERYAIHKQILSVIKYDLIKNDEKINELIGKEK